MLNSREAFKAKHSCIHPLPMLQLARYPTIGRRWVGEVELGTGLLVCSFICSVLSVIVQLSARCRAAADDLIVKTTSRATDALITLTQTVAAWQRLTTNSLSNQTLECLQKKYSIKQNNNNRVKCSI